MIELKNREREKKLKKRKEQKHKQQRWRENSLDFSPLSIMQANPNPKNIKIHSDQPTSTLLQKSIIKNEKLPQPSKQNTAKQSIY